MASTTPTKLRDAALTLFSSRWFETVSIAEVCREAGVSNGVFYRYYRRKDELVRALLDEFLEHLEREIAPEGDTVAKRLSSLIRAVYDAGINYASQVTVFREGQYRFPEYEERIRGIFVQACELVYERPVSEAEYLYTVAGLRFTSTRAIYDGVPREPEIITRLILEGLFRDESDATLRIEVPNRFPEVEQDEPADSRERLIASGMRLIGTRAYHEIGVADIARETNLAVGTFYTYFQSKEEFFCEIVEQIGRRTRRYLSRQAEAHKTRLEQEAYGVWHFLSYFHHHPEYYAIVREAEFVAKPWVRRYYDAFEAGYMENLPIDDKNERRTAANFLMGLSHYVGIEVLLTRRVTDVPAFIAELTRLMCKGVQA
ncbi:MAG: TetR/AcrR family transcriptional regulator [Spirochaetota bacterium]